MTWDAIGATGEWAGAVVVVATLFYLAKQVRLSNKLAIAEADRAFLEAWQDAGEAFVRHYFAYEGTLEWWQAGKDACAPNVRIWIDERFAAPDRGYDSWGIKTARS